MGNKIDLSGRRFGRLTAIEYLSDGHNGKWKCLCDCGKYKIVFLGNLMRGSSQSCGCLARERTIKRNSGVPGVAGFKGLRSNYRRGAIRRGFTWELTDEECFALFGLDCFYCGAAPNQICKTSSWNGLFVYNGLDRVDNTKGYTIANTVPCCKTCNIAKGKLTADEFIRWALQLSKHQSTRLC